MRTPERIVVGLAVVAMGSFFLEVLSFHLALQETGPRTAAPLARVQRSHRAPRSDADQLEAIKQALTVEYHAPAAGVVAKKKAPPLLVARSAQEPEVIAPVAEAKVSSNDVAPEDAIRMVLRQKRPLFEYCFDQELKKQAVFNGFVVLTLSVGVDGRVTQTHVEAASRRESAVGACIVAQLRKVQLPRLTSEADLILPIRLEASRPEALALNDQPTGW